MGLANIHRIPLIQVIHNDRPQTKQFAVRCKASDLLVFNSHWIEKQTSSRAKRVVVHPCVDDKQYKTDEKGEYITLVNVTEPKGSDTFFWLAENMPKEKFLAVEGGYWKNLHEKKPLKNVTYVDQTDDMKSIYAKSKIVLMPSSYESYGLVAREAIVSGKPVIAHPTPGLLENLDYGGIFIDRDDYPAWKAEIEKLNDKKYYDERRQLALKRHAESTQAEELKAFVEAVRGLKYNAYK